MNIFFKKLKKCNRAYIILYTLASIGYIAGLGTFLFSIIQLTGIETLIRVIASIFFIAWLLIYVIGALISLFTKHNKTFIFISIITIIVIPILFIGSYLINFVYDGLDSFNKAYLNYTTNLVVLKDTEFDADSTIGMINNPDDIEGHQLANKLIEKEKLDNEVIEYDDYYEMLGDLYNQEIDAIFLSSNYIVIFSGEETYKDIAKETKVIIDYSEELKNNDYEIKSEKKLTEPFTVLLMGVDSEKDGLNVNQAFNGDTLMMITFNPNTLSATMFSMPRDMYVPIACRNGAKAKVNSSAAYGTKCVIDTLENITGITIDYYVKLNFKAVVDLVNAVGGITVDVEKPYFTYNHGVNCGGRFCEQDSNRQWGQNTIYLDPGVQTLNGEEALAYARCRALYLESDIARNRHQQQIVEATAKKFKTIRSLDDFKSILNAISKNMDTNMTTDQMLSFYEVAKDILFRSDEADELISIQKTHLEYYDLPVYLPGSNITTSALGYYEASLEAIKQAMRINLELEKAEMPKSYSISYNETYTENIIGKGITDDSRIYTVPNFIGKTIDQATSWANSNSINYSIEYIDSSSTYYNPNILPGLISNQSVHSGTLLENVSSIIFYINNTSFEPEQNEEENVENTDTPEIEIPGGPLPETETESGQDEIAALPPKKEEDQNEEATNTQ